MFIVGTHLLTGNIRTLPVDLIETSTHVYTDLADNVTTVIVAENNGKCKSYVGASWIVEMTICMGQKGLI